jgi:hypothetical protein
MPESVIMGYIDADGTKGCLPGTVSFGALPGCLPMNFSTW